MRGVNFNSQTRGGLFVPQHSGEGLIIEDLARIQTEGYDVEDDALKTLWWRNPEQRSELPGQTIDLPRNSLYRVKGSDDVNIAYAFSRKEHTLYVQAPHIMRIIKLYPR